MTSRPGPSIVLNLLPRHGNRSPPRIRDTPYGKTCPLLPSNRHPTLQRPHACSSSLGKRESSGGLKLWSGLVRLRGCLIGKAITVITRGRNGSRMISITSILALSMTTEETRNRMRITKLSLRSTVSGGRGLTARRASCQKIGRRPQEKVLGRTPRRITTRRQ